MVTGLAFPKLPQNKDSHFQFKQYGVYAATNDWDRVKKLTCLPTLHKSHTQAIYDSLGENVMDTYDHLKVALLQCLSPDTEEDQLAASE